jgi:uncharacterized protein YyaL (SSP411 family)
MNRLGDEASPYLLQHAENPVDWHPWGDEAFELARAEDRPLLVSVGYSACHWCHVMAHESFEDDTTAAVMNERFVNVKVDREERPDVDAVTMGATLAMTGSGGWPTTVFMTPEGQPFYAGTYFPPEPRHGLPSFHQVLVAVSDAWRERRDALTASAAQLVEAVRQQERVRPSSDPLTDAILADAERGMASAFEPAYGGFGRAPKFPSAPALELLLRRGTERGLEIVRRTLDGMAAGGMYDLVGGGFHRYSVDDRWLVPHFEKMLYDNALLASAYLHAWVVTGEARYRRVVEETLEYVVRELSLEGGGLASAQDADTDGVEGLTYTWEPGEEVPDELLVPWEDGRCIVRGELELELRDRLLEMRARRVQPFRDDKAIASWNGLALAALAEAGYRLERREWLEAARGVAEFLLGPLSTPERRLLRSWRDGRTSGEAYLDDYANVAFGLMELHVATGEPRWLEEARRLALLAVDLFADEEHGGFYLGTRQGDSRVIQTKPLDDTPTPSGNSMLAYVLVKLSRIWGDDELERLGVGVLRLVAPALTRAPTAFGWALCALDLYLSPPRELAILGHVDSAVARAALRPFQPNTVVAVGGGVRPQDTAAGDMSEGLTPPPLLVGKTPVEGRPAVYVCERFACKAPVTDPADLEE